MAISKWQGTTNRLYKRGYNSSDTKEEKRKCQESLDTFARFQQVNSHLQGVEWRECNGSWFCLTDLTHPKAHGTYCRYSPNGVSCPGGQREDPSLFDHAELIRWNGGSVAISHPYGKSDNWREKLLAPLKHSSYLGKPGKRHQAAIDILPQIERIVRPQNESWYNPHLTYLVLYGLPESLIQIKFPTSTE